MNRSRRRFLAAAAMAPLWSSARAQAKPGSNTPQALGYLPWWMAEAWRDMPLAQLDRIVLFEAAARADGRLDDNGWQSRARDIAAFARERHIPLDMAVTLHGEGIFKRIYGGRQARRQLAEECARWLDQEFVAGVHLDI